LAVDGHVFIVTKVWNEVVSLDLFWVSWDPLMLSLRFRLANALKGLGDIKILTTKVWNEIIFFETWTGLDPVPFVIEFHFGI